MMALIEDYKLEELLREPEAFQRLSRKGMTAKDLTWRHLVQHSIGHAMNEYYQVPPECRAFISAEEIVKRRFTNNVRKFNSHQHYMQVQGQVLAYLVPLLEAHRHIRPVILFESHRTFVPALNLELSVIFQVMHYNENDNTYVVQKVIVDEDVNVRESYRHLAIAFCNEAFSLLPAKIEIHCVVSGHCYEVIPEEGMVSEALDYIHMIRDILTASKNSIDQIASPSAH